MLFYILVASSKDLRNEVTSSQGLHEPDIGGIKVSLEVQTQILDHISSIDQVHESYFVDTASWKSNSLG